MHMNRAGSRAGAPRAEQHAAGAPGTVTRPGGVSTGAAAGAGQVRAHLLHVQPGQEHRAAGLRALVVRRAVPVRVPPLWEPPLALPVPVGAGPGEDLLGQVAGRPPAHPRRCEHRGSWTRGRGSSASDAGLGPRPPGSPSAPRPAPPYPHPRPARRAHRDTSRPAARPGKERKLLGRGLLLPRRPRPPPLRPAPSGTADPEDRAPPHPRRPSGLTSLSGPPPSHPASAPLTAAQAPSVPLRLPLRPACPSARPLLTSTSDPASASLSARPHSPRQAPPPALGPAPAGRPAPSRPAPTPSGRRFRLALGLLPLPHRAEGWRCGT